MPGNVPKISVPYLAAAFRYIEDPLGVSFSSWKGRCACIIGKLCSHGNIRKSPNLYEADTPKVRDFVEHRRTDTGANLCLVSPKTENESPVPQECLESAMRVLVADDSGVMRKMIIRSLEAIDITDIVEACDGAEAFSIFQTDCFDLILTDWNMPEKTGLELIQDVRGSGSDIPIIMITTVEQRDAVATAYEAGVNDFLTKPFTTDDLLAKIETHVSC